MAPPGPLFSALSGCTRFFLARFPFQYIEVFASGGCAFAGRFYPYSLTPCFRGCMLLSEQYM